MDRMAGQGKALNIQPIRNRHAKQNNLNAAARELADYLVSNGQVNLVDEEIALIEAVRDFEAEERQRKAFAGVQDGL